MADQSTVEAYAAERTHDQLVAEAAEAGVSKSGTKMELAERILERREADANAAGPVAALRAENADLRRQIEEARVRQAERAQGAVDDVRSVALERERIRLRAELAALTADEVTEGDPTPDSVRRVVDDIRPEYVSTVEVKPAEDGRIPTLGELPPDAAPVDDPSRLYPEARDDFSPVVEHDDTTNGR